MEMYIALGLAALAAILLFSPDTILDKNSSNATMKKVYDNAKMVAIACGALAYYFYNQASAKSGVSTGRAEVEAPATDESFE